MGPGLFPRRMLFVHIVQRDLPDEVADRCSDLLFEWAEGQARTVGAARGLRTQQIDTGAFQGDERQARWLADAGFERVRTIVGPDMFYTPRTTPGAYVPLGWGIGAWLDHDGKSP